jgi:hypothetical protein
MLSKTGEGTEGAFFTEEGLTLKVFIVGFNPRSCSVGNCAGAGILFYWVTIPSLPLGL